MVQILSIAVPKPVRRPLGDERAGENRCALICIEGAYNVLALFQYFHEQMQLAHLFFILRSNGGGLQLAASFLFTLALYNHFEVRWLFPHGARKTCNF